MLIKDLFPQRTVVSLEIFPPKPGTPLDTIWNMVDEVKELGPDFISVTYGAGGSSKRYTVDIASMIKNRYNIESLAHLTCIGSSVDEIDALVQELQENKIENILALRGDYPQDSQYDPNGASPFKYAKDLVAHIKPLGNFSISAACYPEGHLECHSKIDDLRYLKEKVDAGADFLITQMFFDNRLFVEFKEKLDLLNIHVPVSVGIMPVISKNQIERITGLCGATIAPKFRRIIDKYEHRPEALKEAGIAYATEQIIDLISYGVDGIHLYAMNRPEIAKRIFSDIANIRRVTAGE